ncbi:hypothetical protein TWF694_004630 [Orbilia ellipsospora]|uniref:Jacalin-type lectin domain-containing protein n=1 Tax=Orbilia ellipsospora TaxID=2528407 RepID=A0AAV9WX06_9PEZI
MAPPTVPPPPKEITAITLTRWLSDCQQDLADWEADEAPKTLTENRKIRIIGKAIPDTDATRDLYNWYDRNSDVLTAGTLPEFLDQLKQEALGKNWGLNLLRELYTDTQGGATVKEYLNKRDKLCSIVASAGFGVPAVTAFAEKCHYLFQADPGIVDAILEKELNNDIGRLVETNKKLVAKWLIKYESSRTGASPPPYPSSSSKSEPSDIDPGPSVPIPARIDSVIYLVSPCTKSSNGVRFDDFSSMSEGKSGTVKQVTVWSRGDAIDTYSVDRATPTSSSQPRPPTGGAEKPGILTFNLGLKDYIDTFQYYYGNGAMRRVGFVTSKGIQYTLGNAGDGKWDRVYKAPSGWAIVGFHGYFYPSTTSIYHMGCIFGKAP